MTPKALFICSLLLLSPSLSPAQPTATANDVRDDRPGAFVLTGATVHVDPDTPGRQTSLRIRDGHVEGTGEDRPDGYVVIDLTGFHLYPALIDLDSQYGLPEPASPKPFSFSQAEVLSSPTPGPFNVNQAIRSHINAADHFTPKPEDAARYRELGFATLLVHWPDGIARGTGALVTTADGAAASRVINPAASAHYSFQRGSSEQSYPISMMGAVALLRQTHLDAQWYAAGGRSEMTDRSLDGWLTSQSLPQLFTVRSWQSALRAAALAAETGQQFIIRGGGDEYQRIDAMAATGHAWIVGLDFPEAPEVSDPWEADLISLTDMKHWELAPGNAAAIDKAGISFALTGGGHKEFWTRLRRALDAGLSESTALAALTTVPARMLGEAERLGHLRAGALANILVSDGELFASDRQLLEIWVQGQRHQLAPRPVDRSGTYTLELGDKSVTLEISAAGNKPAAKLVSDNDSEAPKVAAGFADNLVTLSFGLPDTSGEVRLKGWADPQGHWQGSGVLADGSAITWTAQRQGPAAKTDPKSTAEDDDKDLAGSVTFPFTAYGQTQPPTPESVLIRGATVWTLEGAGRLDNASVLVRDGKIQAVGNDLTAGNARVVDASGLHLTPGIIDEHSHIALSAVNDIATNSSMVRMGDVVDSEDINIYRNLAGGVTAAQLLHGSANPIGGQSALVKMRWGALPRDMLIKDADGFIKFALGENVKRSANPSSVRYPQTRMGVEQVFVDAFSAARDYQDQHARWNRLSRRQQAGQTPPRRDLALETMAEILNRERFVTAHSYVQSEINMLMNVANRFDFAINTFTHILEGYKVADLMAAHGAGGSTFADWWAYKWEVRYAIPYNAALMQQAGVTVAINSDSSEMSRRLNQEAAKTMKYGNLDEISALKTITLNPARLLHLEQRMGSIAPGKDADLVLWNTHPLSIDARALTTWVDGAVQFDHEQDLKLRTAIASERGRLSALLLKQGKGGKGAGGDSKPPKVFQCDSLHGYEYLSHAEVL